MLQFFYCAAWESLSPNEIFSCRSMKLFRISQIKFRRFWWRNKLLFYIVPFSVSTQVLLKCQRNYKISSKGMKLLQFYWSWGYKPLRNYRTNKKAKHNEQLIKATQTTNIISLQLMSIVMALRAVASTQISRRTAFRFEFRRLFLCKRRKKVQYWSRFVTTFAYSSLFLGNN